MVLMLFLGVAIDQYTKYAVYGMEESVIHITSFFTIKGTLNPGVSFGMFADLSSLVLAGVTSAIVLVFVGVWWCEKQPLSAWSYTSVLSGAVSNIIDRVRIGGVIDFLDFHAAGYHFPTFNVADVLITLGAAGLLIDSLHFCRKSRKT